MEKELSEYPQLNAIQDCIQHFIIHNAEQAKEFCNNVPYIEVNLFVRICDLYGYPMTIIHQLQYTDKMYRDAYYVYLSHLHFDIDRHCQRLALFMGEHLFETFFDSDSHNELQEKFIGTMVIRPSYNHAAEYTLGRTLLNPYKLKRPYHYIRTAQYKITICGQTYMVKAFPFSNQHGDILRCAETSVWALMEYYGTRYENYNVVLPSSILNWASKELSERSLPSEGLTYTQISSLLKSFNFEPRIYDREAYSIKSKFSKEELQKVEEDVKIETLDELGKTTEIFMENFIKEEEIEAEAIATQIDSSIKAELRAREIQSQEWCQDNREVRKPSLHNFFHYYVESGIPLITDVCNSRENIHHSIVVIGHDERSPHKINKKVLEKEVFKYGNLMMLDSSVMYDRYITIDDNQYPYRSERFDHFSIRQNCKVEAFIVPLYKHILLDAESAVSIIDRVYIDFNEILETSLQQLAEENGVQTENSIDNPIVLRYYLTTSRGFVSFRNKDTAYLEEKLFYSTASFPKFIWVGEYSTMELYCKGEILGEVIVDATAPKYSGMGAVIAMRMRGRCVSRRTDEPPEALLTKLLDIQIKEQPARLVYNLYTNNLQKGDFV